VVEDSEVDLDVFEFKKKLLKSDSEHKNVHNFQDFVNGVHNFGRATTPNLG